MNLNPISWWLLAMRQGAAALVAMSSPDAKPDDLGVDDPAYAEAIASAMPDLTLIGPDAGAALRAQVYA